MPYLTPDELPEGDICRPLFIPDSTAFLAIVSGAITELGKVYNWQQFGTLTPEQCAERMQAMIEQYYADACGDCDLPIEGPPTRIGGDGMWEEWNGDEWVEPTGDRAIPAVPARTDPTSEERRCIAAANAAQVFAELYEQAVDYWNAEVDPAAAFTSWIGVGSTKIMLALGFLSAGTAAFMIALWTVFYAAIEFVSADEWTAGFDARFKCMLYECSQDDAGVVTFEWGCVVRKLVEETDWLDINLGEQRLAIQIFYMVYIVGIQSLNLAGATTDIETADCSDCDQTWCWNSIDATDLETGWTPHDNTPWSTDCATWGSDSWIGADKRISSTSYSRIAWLDRSFAEARVTNITIEFDLVKGGSPSGTPALCAIVGDGVTLISRSFGTSSDGEQTLVWTGDEMLTDVQVFVRSSIAATASYSGVVDLFRITMRGIGENPFGENNCGDE